MYRIPSNVLGCPSVPCPKYTELRVGRATRLRAEPSNLELLYHHLVSSGSWSPGAFLAANGSQWQAVTVHATHSCRSPPTQAPSRAASFLSLLFFFLYAKVHTVHACFHGFMLSQPARIRASPVCDRFHVHALPGRLRVPGQLFHWVPTTKAPLALATYRRLAYTYHKNVLLPSRDKSSQDKTRQGKKKNGRPPPLPCTADIIPSHSSVPRANPAMKANPARAPPHAARGTQYHS